MAFTSNLTPLSLLFLRPLALPQVCTITRFLGGARLSTTVSTPQVQPPQSSRKAVQSYQVLRTPSDCLPVYLLAKRGGNLKQTRLRKIEGDIAELRKHLQDALEIENATEITINPVTKHIIIKGWRKSEVERFLMEQGF